MRKLQMRTILGILLLAGIQTIARAQQPPPPPPPLPAVPVPTANPITEEKRLLGKLLFWEESVSGNSTVACGTCHSLGRSGTDGRIGINPGTDASFGDVDDVRGSFGVVHSDANGVPIQDPVFGFNVQVTRRAANAAVNAAFNDEVFWDGRAGTVFTNPETNSISIASGGALENQALGPILSSVEMGHDNRTWKEVEDILKRSEPLADATGVPSDLVPTITAHKTYPDLFQAAYGDPAITAERIAFAVATYERTLIANQTPYDRSAAQQPGGMTPAQQRGFGFIVNSPCGACHAPPTFAIRTGDNKFRNIGLRPPTEDTGRKEVTLLDQDRGKFKIATLRGVGLKATYMHNGEFNTLPDVIAHYAPNAPGVFLDNIDPLLPVGVPPQVQPDLIDFMQNALTDPRLAANQFPFDQPTLQAGNLPVLSFGADKSTISWPPLAGISSYVVYRGNLSDLVDTDGDGLPDAGYGTCVTANDPDPTDTVFVDADTPAEGHGFFYLKGVRDGATIRGLGVTSAVKPRVPAVLCP